MADDGPASDEPQVVGASGDALIADENHESTTDANQNEDDTAEVEELPSMEDMEDLILEAYNNMQSDGEHIFLPPDVASKLHYIAQLVKTAGYISDDVVSISSESNQEDAQHLVPSPPSSLGAMPVAASSPPPPTPTIDHNTLLSSMSALHLNGSSKAKRTNGEIVRPRIAHTVTTTAKPNGVSSTRADPKKRLSRDASEQLSITDLHTDVQPSPATLSPEPEKPRSRSASQLKKPEVQRKSAIPPPSDIRRKTSPRPPSSTASAKSTRSTRSLSATSASGASRAPLSTSRVKTESAPTTAERSTSAYEQRREAALKLKEEKAQRELQAREAVRKQREEAKRKLEDAQQKELEAKRERVARLKMQKDQRKVPTKSTTTR